MLRTGLGNGQDMSIYVENPETKPPPKEVVVVQDDIPLRHRHRHREEDGTFEQGEHEPFEQGERFARAPRLSLSGR